MVHADLAKVCLSHHEDDLFDLEKYQINRVYGDESAGQANLHAALILRTADVLQIQKKRVPPVLYKLIDPSNPTSQAEWAKQAGVRAVKPKYLPDGAPSDVVEVHASFDRESAYFGLFCLPAAVRGSGTRALLSMGASGQAERRHVRALPWRVIDSSQVEPLGFEGRSYSFRLDQEKILKLLTGHTLYNDYRVAVREVLQNALDAVGFRKHLNKDEPIGRVDVFWDSKARKLTVRDPGSGMTQDTIENFLLNVGSSFYQSESVLQKRLATSRQ